MTKPFYLLSDVVKPLLLHILLRNFTNVGVSVRIYIHTSVGLYLIMFRSDMDLLNLN